MTGIVKLDEIQNNAGTTTLAKFENGQLTGALSPATGFKNRVINGDMRIDQRNAGAAVTVNNAVNFFAVDRFYGRGEASDGVFTLQQDADAPAGFRNSIKATVTTADASIGATQTYRIEQRIEGFNTADFAFGTASAVSITLSFWVKSSLVGVMGGSVFNASGLRSYPFTYSIASANTWEYKSITIEGDTTGTWLTDNGSGLFISLSLGAGSDRLGTAGAWSGSFFTGATGQTNLIATSGATFYLTGVSLEKGTVATPFEFRSIGQELGLCQRYFEVSSNIPIWSGNTSSTSVYYLTQRYAVIKRAAPTVTLVDIANVGFPAGAPTLPNNFSDGFLAQKIANGAVSGGYYQFSWTASAEL